MLKRIASEIMQEHPGSVRVTPLPFPYARAHFKVDFGGGKYELVNLRESHISICLGKWAEIELPPARTLPDMPALRAYTICRSVAAYCGESSAASPESVSRLIRLLLGDSPSEKEEAADTLSLLYAARAPKELVIPCALRLMSL